jgi:hypothetical protein
MWVRKRLDIRWSELASALRDCLLCWERDARGEDLEELWSAGDAFVGTDDFGFLGVAELHVGSLRRAD